MHFLFRLRFVFNTSNNSGEQTTTNATFLRSPRFCCKNCIWLCETDQTKIYPTWEHRAQTTTTTKWLDWSITDFSAQYVRIKLRPAVVSVSNYILQCWLQILLQSAVSTKMWRLIKFSSESNEMLFTAQLVQSWSF